MLIKRTVLLFVIILSCLTVIKGQTEEKKVLVKTGISGFTLYQTINSDSDSVMYYVVSFINVRSFKNSTIPNYSWISFYSKEDVIKWFDEAISASHQLNGNPDIAINGEEVVYTWKSGKTLISANYKPTDYSKCTAKMLEKAKKTFIKKTM